MARPSKYNPDMLPFVAQWAREGAIDREIAKNLGISEATLNAWKHKFPEFLESLKQNKNYADAKVEAALFKRAIGYEIEVVTQEVGESFKQGSFKKATKTTKHFAPDVTAQIFWLKNRRPDRWRDKPEGDNSQEQSANNFEDALTRATTTAWDGEDNEDGEESSSDI
jgi:hypothetical protein